MPQALRAFGLRHRALLASLLTLALALAMGAYTVWPILSHPLAWGGHDWDMVTSFRYLTIKSIRQYHEFPFWNPYACGGYPAWGYVEAGTNVVPWLPLYLLVPLRLAVRVEVFLAMAIGITGTWAWARSKTKSPGLQLFATAIFCLNTRMAMQTEMGHLMHAYYGIVPWVFFFFDRTVASRTRTWATLCAGSVAFSMLVYTGAIYPLPQTALLLGFYALVSAVAQRRFRPLWIGAVQGFAGLCLAAPKLGPIAETFLRTPRLTESTESLDALGTFLLLILRRGESSAALRLPQWGFHEWGIYIGVFSACALTITLLVSRAKEDIPIRWTAMLALVCGFGAFHAYAPWTLIHKLPVFRSQHVPSRWVILALLFASILLATIVERWLAKRRFRAAFEVELLAFAVWVSLDIAKESRPSYEGSFWMEMKPFAVSSVFHQEHSTPGELQYVRPEWSPPSLPPMVSNTGVIECWSVVPMSAFAKDASGKVPGLGAIGKGDPRYRGEVFSTSKVGEFSVLEWSPNHVVVQAKNAAPGDTLVINQNYDAGWSVGGKQALNYEDAIAAKISQPNEVLTFRFRPRTLPFAMVLFVLTVAGWIYALRRERQHARSTG